MRRFTTANIETFVRFKSEQLVQEVLNSFGNTIDSAIAEEVEEIFKESDTIKSLKSGTLRAHFGLTDADLKADSLVRGIKEIFQRNLGVARQGIAGDFRAVRARGLRTKAVIRKVPLDFSGLTGEAWASQENTRDVRTESGTATAVVQRLPWLSWLLLAGRSRNIVRGFAFVTTKIGRSGLPGIMKKAPGGWRVPNEFAGSKTNNFINREINANSDRIASILNRELTLAIRSTRKRRR